MRRHASSVRSNIASGSPGVLVVKIATTVPERRDAVLGLRERGVVHPARARYATPRTRTRATGGRTGPVGRRGRAKPPVGEPNDGRNADAGERRDDDAVDRADGSGRAMPPEAWVGQRTSARLRGRGDESVGELHAPRGERVVRFAPVLDSQARCAQSGVAAQSTDPRAFHGVNDRS